MPLELNFGVFKSPKKPTKVYPMYLIRFKLASWFSDMLICIKIIVLSFLYLTYLNLIFFLSKFYSILTFLAFQKLKNEVFFLDLLYSCDRSHNCSNVWSIKNLVIAVHSYVLQKSGFFYGSDYQTLVKNNKLTIAQQ